MDAGKFQKFDMMARGGVEIEDDVMIWPGVSLLTANSVAEAGAVVTKDVEAYTVVGGSPAHVLRVIERGYFDEEVFGVVVGISSCFRSVCVRASDDSGTGELHRRRQYPR